MKTFKDFLAASKTDGNITAGLETVTFTNKNGKKFAFPLEDLQRSLQALWLHSDAVEKILGNDWKYEEPKFREAFGEAFKNEINNSVASNIGSQTPNTVRCLELYACYLLNRPPEPKLERPEILKAENLDRIFYGKDLSVEFENWLLKERGVADKSADSYRNAVTALLSRYAGKKLNLISSPEVLAELRPIILTNPDFIRDNNTGKQMYSAALNHYTEFLKERSRTMQKSNESFGSQHRITFRANVEAAGLKVAGNTPEMFIAAILSKPFTILTGNSGTGKTKLAELFAQWLCGANKEQMAVVPVGADWTDNRNVLGFVNHIRETEVKEGEKILKRPVYQSTRILDLLLTATDDSTKPYFLILDEMNLSHVERYFADFLSAMESKDGGLILHREGKDVKLPRNPDGKADVPETLELPRNVFVIGTVNVDETTYMFSPKVLDRANVIEFRVDKDAPAGFLASGGRPIDPIEAAPDGYAEAFLELSKRARGLDETAPLTLAADPANPPADAKDKLEKCRDAIADLFALMQKSHQEFAFRSMAEMLRFLAVDYELTQDKPAWDWQSAMDAQILQKILPKLHGSKRKIGSLLASLAAYCEKGDKEDATKASSSGVESYNVEGEKVFKTPEFKDSHRKLCEMILAVKRDQFVSFIQ
jgi:hypothetical protein